VARRATGPTGEVLEHRRYLVESERNLTGYSQVLAEVDATTGQVVLTNLFADALRGQNGLNPNQPSHLVHSDALGSIRTLTPAGAGATPPPSKLDYTTFGTPVAATGDQLEPGSQDPARSLTNYAFTGERRDAATGLQYHRARWLGAAAAAWTSSDPILDITGSLAHSRNWVGHDGPNSVDPTGRENLISQSYSLKIQSTLTSIQAQTSMAVLQFAAHMARLGPIIAGGWIGFRGWVMQFGQIAQHWATYVITQFPTINLLSNRLPGLSRIPDFVMRARSGAEVIMEAKYQLPRAGEALSRMMLQLGQFASHAAANGGHVVVWTYQPTNAAEIAKFLQHCTAAGVANPSSIRFVHGMMGLAQYLIDDIV